jgi:hypothetical protein
MSSSLIAKRDEESNIQNTYLRSFLRQDDNATVILSEEQRSSNHFNRSKKLNADDADFGGSSQILKGQDDKA